MHHTTLTSCHHTMAPPTEKAAEHSREASPITHPHVGRSTTRPDNESKPPIKRAATLPSTTSPQTLSPNPSREASPIRPPLKPGTMSSSQLSRSRKNSQDLSPHRAPSTPSLNTVPSAAAIQRALSVTGLPQIPSPTNMDFSTEGSKLPRPNRAQQMATPAGAAPPRLKSPPPSLQHRPLVHSPRKLESSAPPTPSIFVERPTPVSTVSREGALEEDDSPIKTPLRAPLRGKASPGNLETVQESSLPATPAISGGASRTNKAGDSKLPSTLEENPLEETSRKHVNKAAESGSDSAGSKVTTVKAEARERKPMANNSAYRAPAMNTRRSFTHLTSTKSRVPTEGSAKNMTVETETVSSIPQTVLGGAGERGLPGRSDAGGSLRLKPSSETIRPKKEKRKPPRKTPTLAPGAGGFLSRRRHHHHSSTRTSSPSEKSVPSTAPQAPLSPMLEHSYVPLTLNSGTEARVHAHRKRLDSSFLASPPLSRANNALTSQRLRLASSKADIFEAKVASAVGQADSEDSDETFVYESNPPEPHSGRPSRFHSRTPSAASMASQVDHWGNRVRQDGHHSIAGKKSMKFTNNSYHTNGHHESADSPYTGGSTNSARTPGGNTTHHHHIGRHGRGTAGYPSILDQESPFPNVAKSYRTMNNSLRTSRPSSPRNPPTLRASTNISKGNAVTIYDLEADAADDERTPLVGSTRSARNRCNRRPIPRNYGSDGINRRSSCRRIPGCLFLGGLIGFLIAVVVVALVMVSKPLMDVHVKDLQNVLASEQEIMLDLNVHAINPNLIAIQVSDLDVFVYAKSKYVGTSETWRKEHGMLPGEWENRTRHGYLGPGVGISGRDDLGSGMVQARDGVDEGNDPIADPEGDSHLMLLGSIYHFDSPLVFDASPIRHSSQSSVGELRLGKPGNSSEEGGTERWERVLEHPFELIVRGVLHYSLPISSGVQSAKISGTVTVEPQAGDEAPDGIHGRDHDNGYDRSGSRWRGRAIEFSA